MDYRIVQWPAFRVMGIVHRTVGSFGGDAAGDRMLSAGEPPGGLDCSDQG